MFKVTYMDPGEEAEQLYGNCSTIKEAMADAESGWDAGTRVRVWKLVKEGEAKDYVEWLK